MLEVCRLTSEAPACTVIGYYLAVDWFTNKWIFHYLANNPYSNIYLSKNKRDIKWLIGLGVQNCSKLAPFWHVKTIFHGRTVVLYLFFDLKVYIKRVSLLFFPKRWSTFCKSNIFSFLTNNEHMVVKRWWPVVVQLLSSSVCVLWLQMACCELLESSRYFCGILQVSSTPVLPPDTRQCEGCQGV